MNIADISSDNTEVQVPGVTQQAQVWKITPGSISAELPADIWVVESEAGEQFFHRLIIGMERTIHARGLLRAMIWGIRDELLAAKGTFAQWVPLNGGRFFQAADAMAEISGEHNVLPLQTTFVEAGRAEEPKGSGQWEARVWNSRKGYFFADNLIIAEGAMASGSTGEAMVKFIVDKARDTGEEKPKCIWLFVAAGSIQGIERTYRACKEHNIELKVVLSQALFKVTEDEGPSSGKTLTDLCLLHPETFISRDYAREVEQEWQMMQGCAVGDVGEAFTTTARYTLNTCQELFGRLKMDPRKIQGEWCSFDLPRLLGQCPFLLQAPAEKEDRKQIAVVKAALIGQLN